MRIFAAKAFTPNAMTECEATLPSWVGRPLRLSKTYSSRETQEGGTPAPAIVRPLHRADVHIFEPEGSELGLHVRIHTVGPDLPVQHELAREEQVKCQAYGQRQGFDLHQFTKGMIPAVLEQCGKPPWGAGHIPTNCCRQNTTLCPTRVGWRCDGQAAGGVSAHSGATQAKA